MAVLNAWLISSKSLSVQCNHLSDDHKVFGHADEIQTVLPLSVIASTPAIVDLALMKGDWTCILEGDNL